MNYKDFQKKKITIVIFKGMIFEYRKLKDYKYLLTISIPTLSYIEEGIEHTEFIDATRTMTSIEAYNSWQKLNQSTLK